MQVRFEVTRDPLLLEQYYRIRERSFREDLGLPGFDGSEDEWDRRSQVLIAREGDHCLGGVRITGRGTAQDVLPLEEEGVALQGWLATLPMENPACCQWGRLALRPEVRSLPLLQALVGNTIKASRALGYQWSLMVAGESRIRLYRRLYVSFGYRYEILHDTPVAAEPGFEGLPHLLSAGYLLSDAELFRGQWPKVA